MTRWKVAIFDWNGTLLGDERLAPEMLEEIFAHFGVQAPSLEQFREKIGGDFTEFFYNHGIPRPETAQAEEVQNEIIRKVREDFIVRNQERIHPRSETKWLLENCRQAGLGIALISAESKSILDSQLAHYELREYFNHILTDARPTKESALREVVERLFKMQPQQCCYIGDTSSDVRDAKKVDMKVIALTQGLSSKECLEAAHPDFTADSLTEVWEIIERNSR